MRYPSNCPVHDDGLPGAMKLYPPQAQDCSLCGCRCGGYTRQRADRCWQHVTARCEWGCGAVMTAGTPEFSVHNSAHFTAHAASQIRQMEMGL